MLAWDGGQVLHSIDWVRCDVSHLWHRSKLPTGQYMWYCPLARAISWYFPVVQLTTTVPAQVLKPRHHTCTCYNCGIQTSSTRKLGINMRTSWCAIVCEFWVFKAARPLTPVPTFQIWKDGQEPLFSFFTSTLYHTLHKACANALAIGAYRFAPSRPSINHKLMNLYNKQYEQSKPEGR